jgi:type VI secretion system protein ImpL
VLADNLVEILADSGHVARAVYSGPSALDSAESDRFDIDAPPLGYRFGLYQGRKIAAEADVLYDELLTGLMLPRIAYRLARLLQDAVPKNDLESIYSKLKAYLMLYDAGHYQPGYLVAAVAADWQGH